MTGTYKLHLITSTAQLDPKTRRSNPKVSILCPSERGKQLMKRVLLKKVLKHQKRQNGRVWRLHRNGSTTANPIFHNHGSTTNRRSDVRTATLDLAPRIHDSAGYCAAGSAAKLSDP